MQLVYRSITYKANIQLMQTVEKEITATFLGSYYRLRRPVNLNLCQHPLTLKFRGIEYTKGQATTSEKLIESMQVFQKENNVNHR
jgi:hypothetical protein